MSENDRLEIDKRVWLKKLPSNWGFELMGLVQEINLHGAVLIAIDYVKIEHLGVTYKVSNREVLSTTPVESAWVPKFQHPIVYAKYKVLPNGAMGESGVFVKQLSEEYALVRWMSHGVTVVPIEWLVEDLKNTRDIDPTELGEYHIGDVVHVDNGEWLASMGFTKEVLQVDGCIMSFKMFGAIPSAEVSFRVGLVVDVPLNLLKKAVNG